MVQAEHLVCGVDGCRDGWIAVTHDLRTHVIRWQVVPQLAELLSGADAPRVIAVDIPVGLPERGLRACDTEARTLLGARRSSVFSAPIRPMLAAETYAEACAIGRATDGRALSIQAWGIIPKIREVDALLRSGGTAEAALFEVHPELSFRALNDGAPLAFTKKSREGRAEREALLRAEFGAAVDEAQRTRPRGCASDDLLDAFAAAWSAGRIARGESSPLPATAERDVAGLPMRIVF